MHQHEEQRDCENQPWQRKTQQAYTLSIPSLPTPAHHSNNRRDSRSTTATNPTTAPLSEKKSSYNRVAKGETMEAETLVWKESALCHVSGCYWTIKLVNWSKLAVNSGQNCKNG